MALASAQRPLHASTGSVYSIVENLAARGLPASYLARVITSSTLDLPREVVLETFPELDHRDAIFDVLFAEDLWLPQQMRAPHFIRLFEAGRLQDGGKPTLHYVALEPVQGARLAVLLDAGFAMQRRLPLDITVDIALAIGRGLASLHSLRSADGLPLGALHPGLSPSSVFICRDGLARLLPTASRFLTRPAESALPVAALAYIAPELARGERPSSRSDLHALGVMMWSMLVGQPLFMRQTQSEALMAVLKDSPPPLGKMGVTVPPTLEALVSALLQKNPAARPTAAEDVVHILEALHRSTSNALSLAAITAQWLCESPAAKTIWPCFASVLETT